MNCLYYSTKFMVNFEDSLDIKHEVFVEMYLKHSIYLLLSCFLTTVQQIDYINTLFRKYNIESRLQKDYTWVAIKNLYFCPICKKQEVEEFGFFYYHREHQFPDVKVCHKHKCILHKYVGQKYKELDLNCKSEPVLINNDEIEAEFKYAKFVNELLNFNLDSNIEEINDIVLTE